MGKAAQVLRGTVPQVAQHVGEVDSLVELHQLRELEEGGKARKGVLSALNDREALLVQRTTSTPYRVLRGVSLAGKWRNRHTPPEELEQLPPHVVQEALRSGVMEPVG